MFDFQFMVKIESVGNMQYSSLIIQATPVFSMLFFFLHVKLKVAWGQGLQHR